MYLHAPRRVSSPMPHMTHAAAVAGPPTGAVISISVPKKAGQQRVRQNDITMMTSFPGTRLAPRNGETLLDEEMQTTIEKIGVIDERNEVELGWGHCCLQKQSHGTRMGPNAGVDYTSIRRQNQEGRERVWRSTEFVCFLNERPKSPLAAAHTSVASRSRLSKSPR